LPLATLRLRIPIRQISNTLLERCANNHYSQTHYSQRFAITNQRNFRYSTNNFGLCTSRIHRHERSKPRISILIGPGFTNDTDLSSWRLRGNVPSLPRLHFSPQEPLCRRSHTLVLIAGIINFSINSQIVRQEGSSPSEGLVLHQFRFRESPNHHGYHCSGTCRSSMRSKGLVAPKSRRVTRKCPLNLLEFTFHTPFSFSGKIRHRETFKQSSGGFLGASQASHPEGFHDSLLHARPPPLVKLPHHHESAYFGPQARSQTPS
jgi:hypothetical protein